MSSPDLPPAFLSRMDALLGDEAPAFRASFSQSPRQALRANTLKIAPDDLRRLTGWDLPAVPWCPESFLAPPDLEARPGRHPYHAAGLYYLQDPSALAAAVLLDPQPGETVLDLCAAPGGKATHLAARLAGEGLLVANEAVGSRTAALIANLERFGAANILVTNEPPEHLSAGWPDMFDRILVDAPCSGEGMFRKTPAARREWRPSVVAGCALRQDAILADAARMLRPGGRLVYATCTFAPEENEGAIARFLRRQPDFELLEPSRLAGFDPGRPDWIDGDLAAGLPLERCVRVWPHRAPGEGHFFAVLTRSGGSAAATLPAAISAPPAASLTTLRRFWEQTLSTAMPETGWAQYGDHLYLLPTTPGFWQGLRVVRAGLRAGQVMQGRFQPDHALALAFGPTSILRSVAVSEAEAMAYLSGQTLASEGPEGWALVTLAGFGLGWGKRVAGVVKNHYPRHLRLS